RGACCRGRQVPALGLLAAEVWQTQTVGVLKRSGALFDHLPVRYRGAASEAGLIRRCAWCQRCECNGQWITRLPHEPDHETATICPNCVEELERARNAAA